MKPSVTRSYLDTLFANRDYEGLVWLSSMICGSSGFDLQHPTYGLSRSLFLFVESLFWFAQSSRSGVWTYFEATPATRQQNMLEALRELGPAGFAEQYGLGMGEWTNVEQAAEVENGSGRTNTPTTRFSCRWLSKTGRQWTSWWHTGEEDGHCC